MNNTLKMIALSAILTLPLASQAKPGDKPGQRPHGNRDGRGGRGGQNGMMQRAAKELGLSEAQKSRLMALMKETQAKRRAIRENKSLTPEQRRAQMQSVRNSSMTRMNAILTPAQRAKLQAMMRRSIEEHRKNGAAGTR